MITVKDNYNIKHRNTFGMDVSCRRWIEYTYASDLVEIFSSDCPRPFKSIGEGSNLLFTHDFEGTLLYNDITDIEVIETTESATLLRVGGGVIMDALVGMTVERGLWGLENLSGIPGTVGAAAVQNVGAYGVELCDVVRSVEVFDTMDGSFGSFDRVNCGYGYRKSVFKAAQRGRYVVTHVVFALSLLPAPKLGYANLHSLVADHNDQAAIRRAVVALRDSKLPDPRCYGNAGSFFVNPVVDVECYHRICGMFPDDRVSHYDAPVGIKIPAAWLIDRAGWRGRRMGGAAVWERQPLVLVNWDGSAAADDIVGLKDAIVQDIYNKFGITLTPEVEIL